MSLLKDLTTATQHPSNAAAVDHMAKRTDSPFPAIWRVIALWLRRRNDRSMLRSFRLRDIHDFCPRHTEAEAEMNKPFWRA
jgi:uncharacterized protein YjiS (DUF1127 family)